MAKVKVVPIEQKVMEEVQAAEDAAWMAEWLESLAERRLPD